MKIFLLDNFDSFTYNLVDQFRVLGFEVVIYRNDIDPKYIQQAINAETQDCVLVLSPGPGAPSDAGCLMELIALMQGKVPMLGICLGHQAMVQHYGGAVARAPEVMHGKASPTLHTATGIFAGMSNPLPVARYHSLVATHVSSDMEILATTNGMTMAVSHKTHKAIGFQFHPESILTTDGAKLLKQTLTQLCKETD
ncbi:aminodeoxychorismate/anthranilate synthase component II [Paraferrimonas sp. SM1919]|uniref:aminodeoxychorismate/anthranilate synthase component II n=1 Tax=Paraferrimonas sp. SM1919 TaxID=2662263 RepID=UPI0013D274A5|nr:aminodeoxychorismate/anthranilate synthase component II [Paraferrimonas sp. SM1919]